MIPNHVIDNVFLEFCGETKHKLVIFDNYPVYENSLKVFKATVEQMNLKVIAFCLLDISDEVVKKRMNQREQRWDNFLEDEAYVMRRQNDYKELIMPTINKLTKLYPNYKFNGSSPLEANTTKLIEIYRTHG